MVWEILDSLNNWEQNQAIWYKTIVFFSLNTHYHTVHTFCFPERYFWCKNISERNSCGIQTSFATFRLILEAVRSSPMYRSNCFIFYSCYIASNCRLYNVRYLSSALTSFSPLLIAISVPFSILLNNSSSETAQSYAVGLLNGSVICFYLFLLSL